METITINLKKAEDRSYKIIIGENLFERIPAELKELIKAHTYVIITDSNVEELYGKKLLDILSESGLKAHLLSFPAGEKNKTRETKYSIEDLMSQLKVGRDSAIVALGGGVVGDLAGFVAATYTRGLPYVQVPTTVVACVDSSVGGKTGVDTSYGKNMIGAFYQPRCVFADISTLKTLPENELRFGLSEVIKYGVIWDGNLFAYLEQNLKDIFKYCTDALFYLVSKSCEIKSEVVERDETESNLRKILNFGHTIGHALENLSGYKLPHGEAISVGMTLEGEIACEMKLWNKNDLRRLVSLFDKAGLPTNLPKDIDIINIIDVMRLDKKSRGEVIEMALPSAIGEMATHEGSYGIRVDEVTISKILASHTD